MITRPKVMSMDISICKVVLTQVTEAERLHIAVKTLHQISQ